MKIRRFALLWACLATNGLSFAQDMSAMDAGQRTANAATGKPTESALHRAGSSNIDLRKLPKGVVSEF